MDSSVIDKEFQLIKNRHSTILWMPLLNRLGYKFLKEDKLNLSISIFELATREFPTISNTFDSLGDGYLAAGNKEKAVRSFTKALQLNPKNSRTKDKLKILTND